MRLQRLVPPLALLAPLALASPAGALDASVRVIDFQFVSKDVAVDVGDTVTWSFEAAGHTVTAEPGQAESFNSAGPNNETSPAGATFQKQFARPGRFNYICIPHQFIPMKGTVVVGEDRFAKSYSRFKQVRRGNRITFRFTLVEPARVVAKLRGASRRSVTRRRLTPGSHAVAFRGLRNGSYRGTVDFTDDFDKLSRVKTFTTIR
jgi:plastocyanin